MFSSQTVAPIIALVFCKKGTIFVLYAEILSKDRFAVAEVCKQSDIKYFFVNTCFNRKIKSENFTNCFAKHLKYGV